MIEKIQYCFKKYVVYLYTILDYSRTSCSDGDVQIEPGTDVVVREHVQ